ncbi:MAG: penicillin-binding protein activator, partial [Steroidobacteraceae bacterium]
DLGTQSIPVLALNFLPADRPAPAGLYQFALSPQDEAQLVARRILADGHRRGVALVPRGDWGNRVIDAFARELTAAAAA